MAKPTKTIELYKGKVKIDFYGHGKWHYYVKDGKKIISVTGATGMVNKPALIDWAVKMMKEKLVAEREAGTYIGIPQIIDASYSHKRIKQEEADKGKLVHAWCDEYVKYALKKILIKPEMPEDENVLNGVFAFLKWEKENKVKWIDSEKLVYSLQHDYVGQMDAKAKVNGKLCPIDYKTGNAVYNEMRYQLAAYRAADAEETGDKYTGDSWLLRFDKNTAEFHDHRYNEHEEDFKTFLACLQLKRRDNQLKGNDKAVKAPVDLPY